MKTVIFANGPVDARTPVAPHCADAELIVAADGGAEHCMALGWVPAIVIGDMDSVCRQTLLRLQEQGARILRHPRRKDKTDLALSLEAAMEYGATEIVIYGALGDRWDMSLANLMLLTDPLLQTARVTLLEGRTKVFLLRGGTRTAIRGMPGETISLIPAAARAEGVCLEGFAYPLLDGCIEASSTLGVSNTLLDRHATVQLERGMLFCIQQSSAQAGEEQT